MMIDAGPLIADGEKVNSRLWPIVRRTAERRQEIRTTKPVLAQVWRDPPRQANLGRALRLMTARALDDPVPVGLRLAASNTADVVDAHLVVTAEAMGTFVLTSDTAHMAALEARFERY